MNAQILSQDNVLNSGQLAEGMRSIEKGDNGDDSDVLPLSLSMSSRMPFDLITQPVLQPDKQALIPHCHCIEDLTPTVDSLQNRDAVSNTTASD